ncbi:MAG: serine/threonine-protein kinase [Leptolyngbyaceae bacterium]|nr:serine/threonine-protein kinase [Leptolyngbyaceae bacterium]
MNTLSRLSPLDNHHDKRQSSTHLSRLSRLNQLFCDRYKIIRPLGRGGFGVTFLAKDTSLPSQPLCVIKQLSPKVDNPKVLDKARERFAREAKILSRLGSHSQIPRLLSYFERDGEFFLVQEYIKGNNLAKEIKLGGPLSENEVKTFLREILPVIDFVHNNRVIHRDIKPPNIIRCKSDGRLVLIDFGAVKDEITFLKKSIQHAETTQFVGTVGFAPPEQLALRTTFSSDLYSLGITCLYLLTGKPPLEFDYDPATGAVLWQNDVDVSDYFAQVLSKMIKIAPGDRYRTVEELTRALELETYLGELGTCMNSRPRENSTSTDVEHDSYVSPIARTAQSIRDWKGRSKSKGSQNQVHPIHDGLLVNTGFLG